MDGWDDDGMGELTRISTLGFPFRLRLLSSLGPSLLSVLFKPPFVSFSWCPPFSVSIPECFESWSAGNGGVNPNRAQVSALKIHSQIPHKGFRPPCVPSWQLHER